MDFLCRDGFVYFLGGLLQYRRAELWKRAEFLAGEMKTFFADQPIAQALTMVDWTARRINLLNVKSEDPKDWTLVTRDLQNRALLPHKLQKGSSPPSPDGERTLDSDLRGLLPAFDLLSKFGNSSQLEITALAPLSEPLGELGCLGDFLLLREVGRAAWESSRSAAASTRPPRGPEVCRPKPGA